VTLHKHGTVQRAGAAGFIVNDIADNPDAVGTTLSRSVEPTSIPEKCAAGAGLMLIGPASIRYVPSVSKLPSARTFGGGN
jgi:hypothetical protein